jgi:hypothetical protein
MGDRLAAGRVLSGRLRLAFHQQAKPAAKTSREKIQNTKEILKNE